MSTAVFVVVLVAGILAAQLMVWSSIVVWFRRRRRVIASRLDSELAAETIIRSPEPGSYRGATVAGYPIVNNDGMIALTRRRLVFQTSTGKVIEVPVTDITGVREAEVFKTAVTVARQHLIIQTWLLRQRQCRLDLKPQHCWRPTNSRRRIDGRFLGGARSERTQYRSYAPQPQGDPGGCVHIDRAGVGVGRRYQCRSGSRINFRGPIRRWHGRRLLL